VVLEASRVEADPDAEGIEISVSDTGIGIDPSDQVDIFEAFSQSDSSITRRFGGTGLGLAITRRLCELMGGDIKLDSAKGRGSRFSFYLPCTHYSPPPPIESGGPLSGRRILVYDANAFMRRSLRNMLATWGVRVFNTGRWERLLGMLDGQQADPPFDMVVLGLSHEEQHSHIINQYLEQLRARYAGRLIILAGSEHWKPPESQTGDAHLDWSTKPIRRTTLKRLLDTWIGKGAETAARLPIHPRPQKLPGVQILVAEDNLFNRQVLRYLLEENGAVVDEAVTGSTAVSAAVRGGHDIILMDLHMPEIDGAEAARQIRARLADKTPPIVALTADVFGESDHASAGEAFDDWLLKPFDPEQLVDRLTALSAPQPERAAGNRQTATKVVKTLPADLQERYFDEIDRMVGVIRDQLDDADPESATRAIHELKGIVGLCGDKALTLLAAQLVPELISIPRADAHAVLEQVKQTARQAKLRQAGPRSA
jgi:CheY-like chemotaxis protein